MSRQIDLSKKLSDADRKYLLTRGRYWEVEANDVQFGKLEPGSNFAGEPGAEGLPDPDGTVGAAKTTTGVDPRDAAKANDGGSDETEEVDPEDLTVEELKEEIEARGEEPVKGKKEDLVKQLSKLL